MRSAVLLMILWMAVPAAGAQTAPASDILKEAQRLRDAGKLTAAAALLRTQLITQPGDGDAARMLAQTLYWLKDFSGAREVYETALEAHPHDTALRAQYARMLTETGDRARARELLAPLQDIPAARAEANALLGTLAYWEGDLAGAKTLFEAALQSDPTHAEARRQLLEIRSITAPWMRAGSGLGEDDQPLDRIAFGLEAGWFATPLLPVTVRLEPRRFRLEDGSTRRLWEAEVALAHYAPTVRLETELAAGVIHRSDGVDGLDWKGRAIVGTRMPRHVTLRFRVERTPYLYTTASLDTPVMTLAIKGSLHWQDPRGWLAEAAYQHQRYPDGNTIGSLYAWQLVPLVHQDAAKIQVGYAFAAENADESRFVPDLPTQAVLPGELLFVTAGHYDPYYTPSDVITHSAIAALALQASSHVTLRFGGAYALRATESAPALLVSAGETQVTMTSRSFTPWNARGSLEVAVGGGVILSANGELGRTSFYEWSMAGVQLTYRFRTAQ
jgi:tetratricopeptide (TPR) repeat protein